MHQAVLIIGDREEAHRRVPEEDRSFGPDSLMYEYAGLGIDEVRQRKHEAILAPATRAHRSFVLIFQGATVEAQNAILKLLEEPVSTTRFYIVVPREDVLIGTVRSRLMKVDGEVHISTHEVFKTFQASSYAKRLDEISVRAKEKDVTWMRAVLEGAEVSASSSHAEDVLENLVRIRQYFESPGASKKMLLEELALTLPASK